MKHVYIHNYFLYFYWGQIILIADKKVEMRDKINVNVNVNRLQFILFLFSTEIA